MRKVGLVLLIVGSLSAGCAGLPMAGGSPSSAPVAESDCDEVTGAMFWQPNDSERWERNTARIAYEIEGDVSLLFVVRTEEQILGVLTENESGTKSVDGRSVPLDQTPPGRHTLILRVYDNRNGSDLDDTDVACEGQDTTIVNFSSSA